MGIGRIESAATKSQAVLIVAWDDGAHREIDLGPIVPTCSALAPLRDPGTFQQIRVAEDGWSIGWPAFGVDLGAAQLRRWGDQAAGAMGPRTGDAGHRIL